MVSVKFLCPINNILYSRQFRIIFMTKFISRIPRRIHFEDVCTNTCPVHSGQTLQVGADMHMHIYIIYTWPFCLETWLFLFHLVMAQHGYFKVVKMLPDPRDRTGRGCCLQGWVWLTGCLICDELFLQNVLQGRTTKMMCLENVALYCSAVP